jgi:aminomethyltransferase
MIEAMNRVIAAELPQVGRDGHAKNGGRHAGDHDPAKIPIGREAAVAPCSNGLPAGAGPGLVECMSTLLRTPLHDFHVAHGGRLVDFAGWEMPVQYQSILEEHRAVRMTAGLFDVSHMGEFAVSGPDAAAFLDQLMTNDISRLFPGRVLYTPMCRPDGGVVDDLLVYHRGADDYLLCVNAGNIAKDFAWMQAQVGDRQVRLVDLSATYALLALQGPRAAAILGGLTSVDLNQLGYYHFAEGEVAGVPCLISRTGYTGEDGFELYHATELASRLAPALMEAGAGLGLRLAGLGARDSLRLEAGYPLYGHEITDEVSPLAAGLGWTVKLDKASPFIGQEALRAEKAAGGTRRLVYFKTGDRRIVRSGTPVLDAAGREAGQVVSGTLSPLLNEAIGSALVRRDAMADGLQVEVRGARLNLHLVKPPFVPLRKGA